MSGRGLDAAVSALAMALAACGASSSTAATTPTAVQASAPAPSTGKASKPTPESSFCPTPTPVAPSPTPLNGSLVREWAQSASATTNYGSTACDPWNAYQATGAPNAECGDDMRAWASQSMDTIDTLTLSYAYRLVPSSVRVFQSYNPGRVTKVSVMGAGRSATIFTGPGKSPAGQPCVTLEISITSVTFAVDTVAITIDQTGLGSWSEIDAVELVGTKA